MSMYNVTEYSSNYSDTISLWFHSEDEVTNFNYDVANTDAFTSFKYKAKLLEKTIADGENRILRNAAITVALNICVNLAITQDSIK